MFLIQVYKKEKVYKAGIKDYIKSTKILLKINSNNINSFHDYKIGISYDIPHIKVGDEIFYEFGYLGEKLEYNKISLKTELLTLRTYIQLYIESIKAYEDRVKKFTKLLSECYIPFYIMTSGDAYDAKDSFKKKFYFWDENGANHIDQKNKLPAITDNYCHLSLGKYNYEKNI